MVWYIQYLYTKNSQFIFKNKEKQILINYSRQSGPVEISIANF